MERAWWKEAVVYQIYPRSFMDSNGDGIGDLPGIIDKLDYLVELGVDVIWLCPIYDSPNDDNGYDIRDYENIMKEFGTIEDFKLLLSKAHDKGLRVIMDLVVNHTSDEHRWFVEGKKSPESPYRDYYIWREGKLALPPNNWGSNFSGPAWKYDSEMKMFYLHLFSPKQPDLNWENPALREEIYSMMKKWLDIGVDGFRMDVINFIGKDTDFPQGEVSPGSKYASFYPFVANKEKSHEYLKEMNEKVLSKYDILTVGETPGATVEDAKKYAGFHRNELKMVFHFDHMNIDGGERGKWSANSFKLTELKKIFSSWQKGLHGEAWNSLYWNNHDQPRAVSRFGCDKSPKALEKSAKMLATCLHMLQGTPYIYQGEEIGMTNVRFEALQDYKDIETLNAYKDLVLEGDVDHETMMAYIHKAGRDNARTPMQWNASNHGGFTEGNPWIKVNPNYREINVELQLQDDGSIFNYYKKLIALRKKHPLIVYGSYEEIKNTATEDLVYGYIRELDGEKLIVINNFSGRSIYFNEGKELKLEEGELLITNYDEGSFLKDYTLRPYEARVYMIK
ncbi:alpha-glucosidase [Alloiococcus sp. CFN-8]|uniref:alpha-glucosidase n=1 Tax=Alloiococcus sp. CFN-8 TaxID=3416081 RepID=UPI003CF5F34F